MAEECHIKNVVRPVTVDGPKPAHVGFPRVNDRFPPTNPKVLVLPFSFSDVPADGVMGPALGGLRGAKHFYEQVSWGKATMTIVEAPRNLWIEIPKTAQEMNFSKESNKRHAGYVIHELLDYAKPESRFEDYDIIYLVGSPRLLNWATAKMEADLDFGPYTSPGGVVRSAVLLTESLTSSQLSAHELGHAWLNLEDEYSVIGGVKDFVGMNRFDLMALGGGNEYSAADMTIWNKYLAGWVDPTQVRCITQPGTTTHFISTNSQKSDLPKAVLVRVSETKVLVIDTWRKSEFNPCCDETIAYVIDASRLQGAGQYRLQGAMEVPGDRVDLDRSHLATTSQWTFLPNEPLTIGAISVRLLASDTSGSLVEVTTSQE